MLTHTHSFSRSELDVIAKYGERRRKRSHTDGKKLLLEDHTHTYIWCIDGYGNEWHQFRNGNRECRSALQPSVYAIPRSNPHFYTFYYFPLHQLWLFTPSQAILPLVSLALFPESITMFILFNIFWCIAFPFLWSLAISRFSTAFSHSVPVLFCPSWVRDSGQCLEAYGLLIKKQRGMRPQLIRTRTDICIALLVRSHIT